MGRPRLARTALAAVALSVPVASVIAVPAASAAPLAVSQPQQAAHAARAAAPAAPARTLNSELALYGRRLEGVRYVYGGTSPSGFDCSGLTQYVYRRYGKKIPRTADDQFHSFHRVSKAAARPGDLIFFHASSSAASYVYHVGIYEGGEYMVAASTGGRRVMWQSYSWAGDTVTFGTITH